MKDPYFDATRNRYNIRKDAMHVAQVQGRSSGAAFWGIIGVVIATCWPVIFLHGTAEKVAAILWFGIPVAIAVVVIIAFMIMFPVSVIRRANSPEIRQLEKDLKK